MKFKNKVKNTTIILIIISLVLTVVIGYIVGVMNIYALEKTVKKITVIEAVTQNGSIAVDEVAELTIEERIRQACESYGISYDIALAIARLETGWFTSDAYLYKNNPGGLSRNEIPINFDSIDEGVEAFICNLANNYFDIGLDTPEKIGQKYCPVDLNWASKVEKLINHGH